MGQKEEQICNWGGIEKQCHICKWDRRKNKFVIGEGLKNGARFVNGTEGGTNLAILGRTNL